LYGVGLFLISNSIGWETALVLAAGTTAVGFGVGQGIKKLYNSSFKEVDIVNAMKVDQVCK
jgi:hypothetical protein